MNNLFKYTLDKYLIGLMTSSGDLQLKYERYFGDSVGMSPNGITLFAGRKSYFYLLPNTNTNNIIFKFLQKSMFTLPPTLVDLTDAMILLGLYHNKYESDYISDNYNYLVETINLLLLQNYGKNPFREQLSNDIFIANMLCENKNLGINDVVLKNVTTDDRELYNNISHRITSTIKQLSPTIAKLIQSVFLTYNPLYNVDGKEETKEQFNLNGDFSIGNGRTTSTTGHDAYILNSTSDRDLETTNSFNNNLKGSTYDINGIVTPGVENKSTISGSVTTKNSESTMNDSDYYDTTKTVQTFGKNGSTSDTYSTKEEGYNGEYSGTRTTTGRTDETNINISRVKQTNNISDSTKANTESPYSNVHVLIRKGNIGVTKSTELIDAERKTAIYNVAQEVAQLIAHEIFEGVY